MEMTRRSYAQFVATQSTTHPEPDFKRGTHAGTVIGDDAFAQKTLAAARQVHKPASPSLETICAAVGMAAGVSDASFRGASRNHATALARGAAAYLATHFGAGTLTELAGLVGRDAAQLGRMATKVRHASPTSPARQLVAKAEQILKYAAMQA